MKVIRDNGHRYITDKDNNNIFIAIMDKDNRMLVKFALSNTLLTDMGDQKYKSAMYFFYNRTMPSRRTSPPPPSPQSPQRRCTDRNRELTVLYQLLHQRQRYRQCTHQSSKARVKYANWESHSHLKERMKPWSG